MTKPGCRRRERPASRWNRASLLGILLAGWIAGSASRAQAEEAHGASEALRFGKELASLGEPDRAIHEYLRCLSAVRWDSSDVARAALRGVALAALEGEDYELAIRWPRVALAKGIPLRSAAELGLYASTALLRVSRPKLALDALRAPEQMFLDSSLADRRAFLEGITRLHLGEWEGARASFALVPSSSSLAAVANQYRDRAGSGRALRRRSPRLARWLSVIPGAGYLYCGLPQTAAAALIVTGLFAESTREAFRSDQNALGGFLTAFSVSWYAGSIYGAGQSAERLNRFDREQFLKEFTY